MSAADGDQAYWAARFRQLEEAAHRDAQARIAGADAQYRAAQREIEGELEGWYRRFADNNGIVDLREAKRLLTSGELREFKWDVDTYIERGRAYGVDGRWAKELENASARFHVTRLEALLLQVQNSVETLFAGQQDGLAALMKRTFLGAYAHTAYEIQRGIGVGWDIAGLNDAALEKVLSRPWAADGRNFSERIWANKEKLIRELQTQLSQSMMLGRGQREAARALAERMNVSRSQAARLVNTENAYILAEAQREAYAGLGVRKYVIVATLDERTCGVCQEMDGRVFDMKDYAPGVTANPFHPNCRTTTAPWSEDMKDIGVRAARDPDTGKTYSVPRDMTYKQWRETFMEGGDKAGAVNPLDAAAMREKNKVSDAEMLKRYKARLGKDAPQTLDQFREIKYNQSGAYETLKALYSYKGRVPEATKGDFEKYLAVKATGVVGTVRIPPSKPNMDTLAFKDAHGTHHGCTLDEAKSYVENAMCSIKRQKWDGLHTCYFSQDGAAYVHDETNKIKTAFPKEKFDPVTRKLTEVFK